MAHSQADVVTAALVAGLACAEAASDAPVAVMAVTGIALFIAPGYLLGQLLVGPRVSGLERAAVVTGLALAVPVLGGLLLYAAGIPLHRAGWIGLLAVVTLTCGLALFLRRRGGRAAPFSWQPAWRVPLRQAAVFAGAILVAAGGVGLARIGVAMQPQPGFTQLWLSPQRQDAHALSLGVSNDQGSRTSYRLVLLRNGKVSATWNLTLAAGQTWQRSVPVTGTVVAGTVAARLYRLPDLTRTYRYVSVSSATSPAS